MNYEVLLHGVPYGQDYWGPEEDRAYATSFYGVLKEGLHYVVETRKVDGRFFCYYTYYQGDNVLDKEGRTGSYFAITYRFDMYYSDVERIFQILEALFDKYVVDCLVGRSQKNLMYLCGSFSEKKEEIKKLENATLELLKLTVVDNKLKRMDESFVHQGSSVAYCNPIDLSADVVLSLLKQHSKVIASPNQTSIKERKVEESLNALKVQQQKDLDAMNVKLEELSKTNNSQKQVIASLKALNEEKEKRLNELGKQREIIQMVSDIKEPITKISNYFAGRETNETKPKVEETKKGKKLRPSVWLNTLLLVLTMLMCLILLFRESCNDKVEANDGRGIKKQYEVSKQEESSAAGNTVFKPQLDDDMHSGQHVASASDSVSNN